MKQRVKEKEERKGGGKKGMHTVEKRILQEEEQGGQSGTRGRMEREECLTNTTTTHTSNCGTRLTGSSQGYDMTTGEFTN